MNWIIIMLEAVFLTIAFTAMILIPLVKNPVWWIADYPKDIREEYISNLTRPSLKQKISDGPISPVPVSRS